MCGGRNGEWVANEIALKFAELAGHAVAAEPLIEFLHGPIAAGGPVLAFVEPADPNAAKLAERAGAMVFTPPATGEPWLDAVVCVVAGQRLATAFALATGRDPDATKGLEKVTRSH